MTVADNSTTNTIDRGALVSDNNLSTTFFWSGTGATGNFQRGTINAENIDIAAHKIALQGIEIKVLTPQKQGSEKFRKENASKDSLFNAFTLLGNKTSPRNTALFTRQLATLIQAGIPILQSLEVLGEDASAEQKEIAAIATTLGKDILAGNTLAEAASNHPQVFDLLSQQLIKAGEASATLDLTLHNIANHQERTLALKAKIKKALIHPISVLAIAAVVTMLMLTKVVPQFEQMFRSQGKTLPSMTAFVIELSATMQNYWAYALVGAFMLLIIFRICYHTKPAFTLFVHQLLLRLPLCGGLIKASCVARFSRTLATTYNAGIPIASALTFAGPVTGNLVYQRAIGQVQHAVDHGESLHEAIAQAGHFPSLIIKMIAIGEQAGVLDTMLEKGAAHYESDVENTIDKILPLLEPAMMALLGLVIGGLITAMYLPVFQMGTVLGG